MSVISVQEKFDGRTGSSKVTGSGINSGHVRTYVVKTDAPDDDTVVLAALPVVLGDAHPSDPTSICTAIDMRQVQTKFLWECTITYDFDPLLRLPTWHVTFDKIQEAGKVDLDGKKLQNTAGDYFVPPIEFNKTIVKLTYEVNQASFNLPTALNFKDKINNATWLGFPQYAVKCDTVEATQLLDRVNGYYKVVYNLSVNMTYNPFCDDGSDPDPTLNPCDAVGWVGDWHPVRVLNEGFSFYKNGDTTKKANVMENGVIKTTPTLLKENGDILPRTGTPFFVEFKMYEAVDFDTLLSIGG